MSSTERWPARALTLEAMLRLILARFLVRAVPLAKWRRTLGTPEQAIEPGPKPKLEANQSARQLARAVSRAAARLPGESRCLPQAMALQWMLRRRALGGLIVIGIRGSQGRGDLPDLHAWVVRDGEVLIGVSDERIYGLYAARV